MFELYASAVVPRVMALAGFVCALILITANGSLAYDGNKNIAEGWTYRICGLGKVGYSSLPLHKCPNKMCPTVADLAENDLVFVYEENEDGRQRVTPVDALTVFLNLDTHEGPFGYASGSFFCDDVPKPKGPDSSSSNN